MILGGKTTSVGTRRSNTYALVPCPRPGARVNLSQLIGCDSDAHRVIVAGTPALWSRSGDERDNLSHPSVGNALDRRTLWPRSGVERGANFPTDQASCEALMTSERKRNCRGSEIGGIHL